MLANFPDYFSYMEGTKKFSASWGLRKCFSIREPHSRIKTMIKKNQRKIQPNTLWSCILFMVFIQPDHESLVSEGYL